MPSNCIIRKAEYTDIPCLIRLLKTLFSIESDFAADDSKQQSGLAKMLDDCTNRCIIVAEIENNVIGMVTAQILVSTAEGGPVALIEDMIVDEDHREKGLGKKLLLSIERWAAEKGATRLQLLADKNNTPALEFYKKMSWDYTQLICLRKNI